MSNYIKCVISSSWILCALCWPQAYSVSLFPVFKNISRPPLWKISISVFLLSDLFFSKPFSELPFYIFHFYHVPNLYSFSRIQRIKKRTCILRTYLKYLKKEHLCVYPELTELENIFISDVNSSKSDIFNNWNYSTFQSSKCFSKLFEIIYKVKKEMCY